MAKTVLVVDDELRMRKLVADFLIREGYHILEAANGQAALELLTREKVDLVILDIMMPLQDGLAVCRDLRKNTAIPVIMLTARGDEADQLQAFELGADEYVVKPFSPKVLTARVNALFRRLEQNREETVGAAGLMIDHAARRVFVNGRQIELSPKEYDLLIYLADNAGTALSRQQILDQVWTYDYCGDLRTVDTHITRLRTKLGGESAQIQTIRGYGYRYEDKK